jgi:hypothetical protein
MSNQMFQGEVSYVRSCPFAMKPWEARVFYRCTDLITGDDLTLPFWFRCWLWLRTIAKKVTR